MLSRGLRKLPFIFFISNPPTAMIHQWQFSSEISSTKLGCWDTSTHPKLILWSGDFLHIPSVFSMCNANYFRREFLVLFYLIWKFCVYCCLKKNAMNKKQSLLKCFRSLSPLKYSTRVYIQDYWSISLHLCFVLTVLIYVFLFKQLFYNTIYGGKQKYAILLNNNFVSSTIWVVFVLAAW